MANTKETVRRILSKLDVDFKYEVPKLPPSLLKPESKRDSEYLDFIKKLQKILGLDPMTGLFTKEKFQQVEKDKGIYIYIDGDGLKKINDTYGHAAGHAAIEAIAKGIKISLRSRDDINISRLGGDEFAVHVKDVSVSGGVTIAKRILENIKKQDIMEFYKGKEDLSSVKLNASLGVGESEAEADKALYKAKEKGRGRVEFHTTKTHH